MGKFQLIEICITTLIPTNKTKFRTMHLKRKYNAKTNFIFKKEKKSDTFKSTLLSLYIS